MTTSAEGVITLGFSGLIPNVCDNLGIFITQWGEEGEDDGQFSTPEGLAIDSASGRVYVSDTSNNNVQVFVPSSK
ncbi:MAG: hypothetical protein WBX01_04700 [Nitrososphaeraceae archaeon]